LEQQQERARLQSARRSYRYRKLKRQRAYAARQNAAEDRRDAKAARLATRLFDKAIRCRRRATIKDAAVQAWNAVVYMTEAEMLELHYSKRFIKAYLETAEAKKKIVAAMQKQSVPTVQPRLIQC